MTTSDEILASIEKMSRDLNLPRAADPFGVSQFYNMPIFTSDLIPELEYPYYSIALAHPSIVRLSQWLRKWAPKWLQISPWVWREDPIKTPTAWMFGGRLIMPSKMLIDLSVT